MKIRLRHPLFMDMDGVLTTGVKTWGYTIPSDTDGKITPGFDIDLGRFNNINVLSKEISDRDSNTLSVIERTDPPTLFVISNDRRVNKEWCEKHDIPFLYSANCDKHQLIQDIISQYGLQRQYVYIGDALPDYYALLNSKYGYYPQDSSDLLKHLLIKNRLKHCRETISNGGHGVLTEVIGRLLNVGAAELVEDFYG